MNQRGAMYEINGVIWPAVYGYTGWLWGTALGWPWTVTIAAVLLGFAVGALMMAINPYGATLIVPWFFLILPWFLDADTWRWSALVLCLIPLPVITAGLIFKKKWV